MYQFSKRVLTVMLCVAVLLTTMTTMTFGQTQGAQEYASKVLYALDPEDLTHTGLGDDAIRASADSYPNVEILGVTDGIRVWNAKYYYSGEYSGIDDHGDIVRALTAGMSEPDPTVKNITYKITSTNPNGFEELNISFWGFAESMGGNAFLAVQGLDTAPSGAFGEDGYFSGFSDLRRITDSEPNVVNKGREDTTLDYYSYGETITLTDTVKGKNVYYINFSYLAESLLETALADISFAEKIPVEYSNTDKYDTVVLANGDVSGNGNGNFLWTNQEWINNIPYWLGVGVDSYDYTNVYGYGHQFFAPVNPENTAERGFSFVPLGNHGFAAVTYKLIAPAGKTFQGLIFDYDGNITVKDTAPAYTQAAITTYVGDTPTELGVAKRLASYTDADGNVAKNLGKDLDAFCVAGNDKNEIWVKLMIAGGEMTPEGYLTDNYLQKMKITAVFNTNKVSQGTEITDANYASKILYSLDTSAIVGATTNVWGDHSEAIRTSAANYNNVDVLGVSNDIQIFHLDLGDGSALNSAFGPSDTTAMLIAGNGVRNITYKITSSNPDGFEELDISYYAGVTSTDGSSYVAIQGSDTAPVGEFGSDDYYSNFGDIRRITDSTPNVENIKPYEAKDYHDYGETLVLTDAVKGLHEYYVNFSFNSESHGSAWISEMAFTEKVPADFNDDQKYSNIELVNMDYSGQTNRGFIWAEWPTNRDIGALIVPNSENCELIDLKTFLFFGGDGTTNWLSYVSELDETTFTAGSGGFVLKLTAPEGKIFKALEVDMKGKNTIDACIGPNMGTSLTVGVGDEYNTYSVAGVGSFTTGLPTAKRFWSYTDKNGVVAKSTGDLSKFTVIGNNKNVMYVEFNLGGAKSSWNYIKSLKLNGIFADESVIDDVQFSGRGAFPTDGTLIANYLVGSPKEGEQMPSTLTFILAVYKIESDGTRELFTVNASTVSDPAEHTTYSVELTGLPQDDNNYCAKAFVWSDLSQMTPTSSVYRLGTE